MKVSSVSEMHGLDRQAIEKYSIPGKILMENAGEAAYFVILNEFGVKGRRFVVICGTGHNGGDGLVVARKLHSTGGDVRIFCMSDPQKFDETVRFHYDMVAKMPIPFVRVTDDNLDEVRAALAQSDAVVDAIFGTGLSRDVKGRYGEVIRLINESGKTVFSIDIPSGVSGDTGQVMGIAVRADYTVTYGLPKIGSLLYPGFELGGKLYVTHISFPPDLYESESLKVAVNTPLPLPPRPMDGHKGYFGKVLFVAGASRYLGAPYFSAMSFLKAGGGLSYLATPRSVAPFIANKGSEIVFLPQEETASGSLAFDNLERLLEMSAGMEMVVLGPGVSLDEETQRLVRELTARVEKPLLVDGDGLTTIASEREAIARRKAPTVLTPHPGEMSRLTGLSVGEILSNRVQVLQEATKAWNAVIVLKGAHSLIGYPDGRVFVNLSGNPGMATAGSGDVLTGTIAAMHAAHKFDLPEATRMGVFMHGLAGDLAAEEIGEDGVVAGDILSHLPDALEHFREYWQEIADTHYGKIFVV